MFNVVHTLLSLYCNAKPLVLGSRVGLDPNATTCWYPETLVEPTQPQIQIALALALTMLISCWLCPFHLSWVANTKAVSSGIWAL